MGVQFCSLCKKNYIYIYITSCHSYCWKYFILVVHFGQKEKMTRKRNFWFFFFFPLGFNCSIAYNFFFFKSPVHFGHILIKALYLLGFSLTLPLPFVPFSMTAIFWHLKGYITLVHLEPPQGRGSLNVRLLVFLSMLHCALWDLVSSPSVCNKENKVTIKKKKKKKNY